MEGSGRYAFSVERRMGWGVPFPKRKNRQQKRRLDKALSILFPTNSTV